MWAATWQPSAEYNWSSVMAREVGPSLWLQCFQLVLATTPLCLPPPSYQMRHSIIPYQLIFKLSPNIKYRKVRKLNFFSPFGIIHSVEFMMKFNCCWTLNGNYGSSCFTCERDIIGLFLFFIPNQIQFYFLFLNYSLFKNEKLILR